MRYFALAFFLTFLFACSDSSSGSSSKYYFQTDKFAESLPDNCKQNATIECLSSVDIHKTPERVERFKWSESDITNYLKNEVGLSDDVIQLIWEKVDKSPSGEIYYILNDQERYVYIRKE